MKPHLPIVLSAVLCGLVAMPVHVALGTDVPINIFAQNLSENETSIAIVVETPSKTDTSTAETETTTGTEEEVEEVLTPAERVAKCEAQVEAAQASLIQIDEDYQTKLTELQEELDSCQAEYKELYYQHQYSSLDSDQRKAYLQKRIATLEEEIENLENEHELEVKDANNKLAEAEAELERAKQDLAREQQEEEASAQTDDQPVAESTPEVKPTSVPQASTVNATGTAQRDALRHHQWGLRDRLATLGQGRETRPATQKQYWVQPQKGGKGGHYVTSSESASDFRYSLWIEGIGDYSKLDQQGGRGGYTLKSWGGSVGAAATVDNNLTLGAAFSATWGDLSSSAFNERATGDLDSLYLDLFVHYQSNAWGHTLILTGTTTDASLNRTGVANGTPFSTHGDTDGYGLGALYELTYDIPLNDAGTSILQPLFDASIVSTSLDAYDETGTGALHVGKQEWTTGTVALGARWLGSFGTETVGQTFFGSLRLAVSQDIGDTRGETTISQGGISRTAYGSKVGSTALQIGAGISTNLTPSSTIYANVNGDFRDRENSVYGSVGYRYSF